MIDTNKVMIVAPQPWLDVPLPKRLGIRRLISWLLVSLKLKSLTVNSIKEVKCFIIVLLILIEMLGLKSERS